MSNAHEALGPTDGPPDRPPSTADARAVHQAILRALRTSEPQHLELRSRPGTTVGIFPLRGLALTVTLVLPDEEHRPARTLMASRCTDRDFKPANVRTLLRALIDHRTAPATEFEL